MTATITTMMNTTEQPLEVVLPDKNSSPQDKVINSKSGRQSKGKRTRKSTKSVAGSKQQPRLYRTLKRNPEFRLLEEKDFKYLWAAYKKGAFGEIKDITPKEFEIIVVNSLNYDDVWILEEPIPIGIVMGSYTAGPIEWIADVNWFPWATERQKLEHVVNFFNTMRKKRLLIWECKQKDKRFYEHIAKYGIIRRIGHFEGLIENEPVILWQTRN